MTNQTFSRSILRTANEVSHNPEYPGCLVTYSYYDVDILKEQEEDMKQFDDNFFLSGDIFPSNDDDCVDDDDDTDTEPLEDVRPDDRSPRIFGEMKNFDGEIRTKNDRIFHRYSNLSSEERNLGNGTLYCSCGYQGDAMIHDTKLPQKPLTRLVQHDHPITMAPPGCDPNIEEVAVEDIRHATRKVESVTYQCPACDKPVDLYIPRYGRWEKNFLEFWRIFDNREKEEPTNSLTFAFGVTRYMNFPEAEAPTVVPSRNRITINLDTGFIYFVQPEKKKVRNITYGNVSMTVATLIDKVSYHPDAYYAFIDMITMALQERGIYSDYLEKLTSLDVDDRKHLYSTMSIIQECGILMRFPQLQALRPLDYRDMPKNLRTSLKQVPMKAKAVAEHLFGMGGKSILRLINDPQNHTDHIREMIEVFGDPNLVVRAVEGELFRPKAKEFRGMELRGATHIYNQSSMTVTQMKKVMDLFPSPSHFVKAAEQTNKKSEFRSISGIVMDIGSMMELIYRRNPDYEVVVSNDLIHMHDLLSRDHDRLRHAYQEIPYEEGEKEFLMYEHGPFTFAPAVSNHELIDVGSALNICVGSYGERAIDRYFDIVTVYDEEDAPLCCLEIKDHNIVQAKVKYNGSPEGELQRAIFRYVKAKSFCIRTMDLPKDSGEQGMDGVDVLAVGDALPF